MSDDTKCPVLRKGDGQIRPGEDPREVYRCIRAAGHQPENAHVWGIDPVPATDDNDTAVLSAVTIEGVVFIDSGDVIAALRRRAEQALKEADSYGDELDEDGFASAVVWHAVAQDMTQRADEFQFAVIAHLAEEAK